MRKQKLSCWNLWYWNRSQLFFSSLGFSWWGDAALLSYCFSFLLSVSVLQWRQCYFIPSLHSITSCSTRMAPRWRCECVMVYRRLFLCSNTQTQSSLPSPLTACRSSPMPTRRVRCVHMCVCLHAILFSSSLCFLSSTFGNFRRKQHVTVSLR